MANLDKIAEYLDRHLNLGQIADWPTAMNGLQLANPGRVTKIAAAVDACAYTINAAIECGADLLIVHHGLFWSGAQPLTGGNYQKFKAAFSNDLAVYSAHLPLDVHPVLGNNALLCDALGLKKRVPFFFEKGQFIGFKAEVRLLRSELQARLVQVLGGPVHLCPGGPEQIRSLGVVTGGAGGEIKKAASEGVDTFITGEAPHWAFTAAEELGVNLFLGGHYATETFGVKALAAHLSRKYRLPWEFIDHPSGL
jgi:dinuclear metal center YbgI/SA1388 family protein